MGARVNYSGLVVAGIGFFLTRFTVTLAIYEDPVGFYLAGIVPLALGLGLAAFGVALAVADVEPSFVRMTALWCVIGLAAMSVLVLLTLLGSTPGGMANLDTIRAQTYLSNFLIGGSVGGTLTGLYAARNRRQRRELKHQANRLEVLNRLLRHEILNAVTVIRGYSRLWREGDSEAEKVVEAGSNAIVRTIEEVKYLTRSEDTGTTRRTPVDLEASLKETVATVQDRYPNTTISIGSIPEGTTVLANERLGQVFTHLLENAVVYSTADEPEVGLRVEVTANAVRVSVRDQGPGLPESQQDLLELGEIEEFDDPSSGFGLNVVRLLVESYAGEIETEVGEKGTTVSVVLPRAGSEGTMLLRSQPGVAGVRPAVPHLVVMLGAAIIAGVLFGIVSEQLGGSVAGIGVFYGFQDPVVGWITHEFHSVVFGFVFAGLVSLTPAKYRNHVPAYTAVGVGWGLFLWVVAAGVIAPVWLLLLGIPATVPNLVPASLVAHTVWGLSLGVLTAWGYEHLTPWLASVGEQFRRTTAIPASANRHP